MEDVPQKETLESLAVLWPASGASSKNRPRLTKMSLGESAQWVKMLHICTNFYLVGGLEHEFYDFPYIGNVIIPTDELIFFRGVGIYHQPAIYCSAYHPYLHCLSIGLILVSSWMSRIPNFRASKTPFLSKLLRPVLPDTKRCGKAAMKLNHLGKAVVFHIFFVCLP